MNPSHLEGGTGVVDRTTGPPTSPGPPDQQRAAGRLALLVGAVIVATLVTGAVDTVAVVVALLVIIMLHELGHFVTAKKTGMKVTEFFVGFGPRLWSVKKGETEYGIKAIPAGGYCRIIGMNNLEQVDPADEPRTYRQQSFPKRISVAVAGSVMHFIIALVLLFALNAFVGVQNVNRTEITSYVAFKSGSAPAKAAGLLPGDILVSVGGHRVGGPDDLPALLKNQIGHVVPMVVDRGGRAVTVDVTPTSSALEKSPAPGQSAAHPSAVIGVTIAAPYQTTDAVSSLGHSVKEIGTYTWQTLAALGHLFSPNGIHSYVSQVQGHAAASQGASQGRLVSAVGFVRLASQAAHQSISDVLSLLVLINIFVGIFNMLPLLPLDGGHVAIAVYERVRSRRRRYYADAAKLMPLTVGFVAVLLLLGVTALYLDIAHPIANPFQ